MNQTGFGPLLIVVSRDEVLRKDISGPFMTLKHLISSRENIRANILNVDISFSGYDNTREELFEIPEVRSYVHALDVEFPYWLYFLSRHFMGLQCLAYCYLDAYLIEEVRREDHPKQLANLIERRWGPALNQICSAAGHTEAEADSLLESALSYFMSGPTKLAEDTWVEDESEDDEEVDSDDSDGLFGLFIEDSGPFTSVAQSIRLLLRRANLPPGEIHQLAVMLLIIESLPRPTPGLHVELDLVERHKNGERTSMGIRAGSDEIRLTCTEYIILDSRVGGDSETEVWFGSSPGGWREESDFGALREWAEQFAARAADPRQEILISSDECDDSEIDWHPESSEDLWEKLHTEYP